MSEPLEEGFNPRVRKETSRRQIALAVLRPLVPGDLDRRQVAAGRKLVGDRRPGRIGLGVDLAALRRHLHGQPKLKCHEGQVRRVTGHVAQRAGAEVPPAAPIMGMVDRVVRTLGGRAQEQVPVHVLGNGLVFRSRDDVRRLLPVLERTIGPDVDLAHLADGTRTHQLCTAAEARVGRALVAHLGAHPFLTCRLAHQASFPDRVGQRLLAIDVLAQTHRRHRGRGVRVVGRRDDDGVDLGIELVQEARGSRCISWLP